MSVIIKRRPLPDRPDYKAACRRTVTLYNVYTAGTAKSFHKTVFKTSAFLDHKRVWQDTKTGVTASNSALLVIPQGASEKKYLDPASFDALENKEGYFTLRNNDKAIRGEGPDIITSDDWSKFLDSNYPGVVVIQSVDVKETLFGDITHVEGGG